MPSPSDPIRALHRRLKVTVVIAAVCCGACVLWVMLPGPRSAGAVTTSGLEPPPPIVSDTVRPPLDAAPFERARLWVMPPEPDKPEPAPEQPQPRWTPPPPSLRVHLIAMVVDDGARRAAFYDPGVDQIVIVGVGDRVAGQSVASVGADYVELTDGRSTRRFTLENGQ